MFHRDVVEDIHRIEHAGVNCYLVEDGDRVMVVDAGLPATWRLLTTALGELGKSIRDVSALVLTHAHFDHLGFAARLQREASVPILVHPGDTYIAAHPYRYKHEKARIVYPLRYPRAIPVLARMTMAGALTVKGVTNVRALHPGQYAELPGQPELIHTPGHTDGHCALHFPDRNTIITGDALVTLDPYTGATGPQIVSAAATADTTAALASLENLAQTDAATVLPGHGEPWHDGVREAVQQAREHGKT
ncbi:MBL fold metallo-hydrolase [Arthrobacter sp. AET 35A]|uniref:MBL fold metallo-hydrolase n=1 Tax=Arthrobacter sp. AET 35A TaxID=2292643 RepID=UPI001784D093|nr:MBL fold metallo-hydrolase [Arthrobacter sp. AET 35A]MBE0011085.1 MBL fold metallo-hydrolase [Arthrobacter sp. AET 35A]